MISIQANKPNLGHNWSCRSGPEVICENWGPVPATMVILKIDLFIYLFIITQLF